MDKSYDFKFSFPINLKADSEGKFYLEGFACTTSLDRQDEIILRTALEKALDDVKMNTTVFYEHKSTEYPIGKIVDSKIVDEDGMSKLYVKVYISKTADTVRTLIEEGILNKFSIGGKVLKFNKVNVEGKEVTEIKDMELYEVSVVGLPANIEAKAIGYEIKKSLELSKEDKEKPVEPEIKKDEDGQPRKEEVKEDLEKSVTGYQDLPLADLATEWDSVAAVNRVRAWAGGEDKEKIDWTKYSKAFMWYDNKDKENFGSYKLPYADIIGDTLKAVPKAISSIVGAVNGARGGVDIPEADKAKVLNHCEKYQKRVEEMKPKEETKAEEVEVLDAGKVMTMLEEMKTLIQQLVESQKNIKVEIKKEELPVQKVEASVKMEEVEELIKKAIDAATEVISKKLETVRTTRKGIVVQTSDKDIVNESHKEDEDKDDPVKTLEDTETFNKKSDKEKHEIIRKGFLQILKQK